MKENDNTKQIIRVLSFCLHKRLFSIPLEDLMEVNRIVDVSCCEKAPDYVHGLINLHGLTTPILDLRKLLKIDSPDSSQPLMWISVKHDKLAACLAVDKLYGFLDIEGAMTDETPTLADGPSMQYIKYFTKINNNLVPVLNVAKIISNKEKKILKTLAELDQVPNSEKSK
jgi:purine-binding chemotaxis protein CheW